MPRRPLPDTAEGRRRRVSRTLSRWLLWGGLALVALLVSAAMPMGGAA